MTLTAFFSLWAFSMVTSITPGPNNMMLLASGVNYGFVRTIPHSIGISIGFFVLLMAVGAGLGAVLLAIPAAHVVLNGVGGAYVLYLSYKIAMSRTLSDGKEPTGQPLTWLQAALFQWVNPKAWIMAVSGMTIYTDPARPFLSVLIIATVFAVLNWPCVALWAGIGTSLRGFLSAPQRLKWFNISMGVLLAASMLLMIVY